MASKDLTTTTGNKPTGGWHSRNKWLDDPKGFMRFADSFIAKCEADGKPVTLAAFAYAVGTTTVNMREWLLTYEQDKYGKTDKSLISQALKKIKTKSEADCVSKLFDSDKSSKAGAMFYLKAAHQYREKDEDTSKGNITINLDTGLNGILGVEIAQ